MSNNANAQWVEITNQLTESPHALLVSGTNLFAGTDAGAFLSTDDGDSWTEINSGLEDAFNSSYFAVLSLVANGTNIFAGTEDGGVFLTTDNGSNWTAVNTGLESNGFYQYISSLAVSGTDIYAGTSAGVFLTTNDGAQWDSVSTNLSSPLVLSLAITGNKIFAGTEYGGISLSMNNGSSWESVTPFPLSGLSIESLAFNSTYLFAGGDGARRRPLSEMTASSGIIELGENANISVYPNPSNGKFMINSNGKINFVEIYNAMGEKVLQEQVFGEIDLSSSPKGIYSVKIKDGDKSYAKNIVVQ